MAAPIHLDTNALIFGLEPGHALRVRLARWRGAGVSLAVSGMAWAEFLCGPVTLDSVRTWDRMLDGAIVPVDRAVAERASALFNRTGRRSRSLPDCIIAATAILHGSRLITLNRRDFEPFLDHGLMLV
ncbi:MAG: PIN domain-containing protein [Gammaproteobacteria bacterium]|nr:PIN domain-containing protein [Gammaproteobacteria bacterium]